MRRVIGWHQGVLLLVFGLPVFGLIVSACAADASANARSVLFISDTVTSSSDDTQALPLPEASETQLPGIQAQFFRRLFAALRPPVKEEQAAKDALAAKQAGAAAAHSPITTAALPERSIIVADADPYFSKWQDQANDRLKQESSVAHVKEHKLATAHPDSFVIVCEAGCRGAPDQIVYQVVKTEAANAGPKPYVPTDSSSEDSSHEAVTRDVPVAAQEPNTILCVAGCYDSPKIHRAREAHRADAPAPEALPLKAAAMKSRDPQICRNGAIIDRPSASKHAAARNAITRAIASRLGPSSRWHTTITKAAVRNISKPPHAASLPVRPRHKGMASKAPALKVPAMNITALKVRRLSHAVTLARAQAATRR